MILATASSTYIQRAVTCDANGHVINKTSVSVQCMCMTYCTAGNFRGVLILVTVVDSAVTEVSICESECFYGKHAWRLDEGCGHRSMT